MRGCKKCPSHSLWFSHIMKFVKSCCWNLQIAFPCVSLYLTPDLLTLRNCVNLRKGLIMTELHLMTARKRLQLIRERQGEWGHWSTPPSPEASFLGNPDITQPHVENNAHLLEPMTTKRTSTLPYRLEKKEYLQ